MADFSIRAILSATDAGFSSGLRAASSSLGAFSQRTQNVANSTPTAFRSVGKVMMATGAAVTAMGVKSLKSFGDFQASLNQAAVVAGGTSKDISGLSDVANKMGADLPLDAQQCADAMVEMARNGASVGQIKQQFPAIAQAATAAGADIKATAGTVQEAMNIWGNSLKSPQQAGAILVQTANASNASIEDMGQALATIGGTANNAGISMQTTSEAIGLLTNKGFSAAQASMDLNHAILQMQAPSKIAKNAMSELGVSFTDAQGKLKQFPQILSELNKAMENLSPSQKAKELKAMFGSSGMQAILPLMESVKNKTNDAKVSWDAYAKEQDKAAGSTKKATATLKDQANEMQKNIGSNIEQLGGNWEALRNKSMQSVQNINGSMITNANNMLTWATTSNSALAQATRGFIGLSPAIGSSISAIGMFIFNFSQIMKAVSLVQKGLSVFFSFLAANPFVAIIGAIALVVAGLVLFFTQTKTGRAMWGSFVNWLKGIWQGLVQVATTVWNAIVQVFNASVNAVKGVWNGISSFFSGLWNGIVTVAKTVWQGLVSFFSPLVNAIANVWRGLTTIVNNVWKSLITGLKPIIASIKNLFSALRAFFSTLWNAIVNVAKVIWQGLVIAFKVYIALMKAIWTPIVAFFKGLWQGIVNVAKAIWQGLVIAFKVYITLMKAIWTPIIAFFKTLWNNVVLVAKAIWNGFKIYIATAFKSIQITIKAGMAIIKTVFSTGWKVLTTVVSAVWKIITTVVSTAINAVAGIIRAVTAVMRGDWRGAWNAIKGVASTIWSGIKSVVTTGINAVKSVVTTVMNAVKSVFSTIWNAIKDIFTTAAKGITDIMKGVNLFDIGKNIVQGLINGIKSMIGSVGSAIGSIKDSIVNGAKSLLGIHSPSTVMRDEVGQYITLGIVQGILSQGSAVSDAMNSLVSLTQIKFPDIKAPDFVIPEINSQKFSDSVNRLNSEVQSNINGNIQINDSNSMTRMNNLLERIANKNTTMVLDDGTLVGKTTDKYNTSLGKRVSDRERWS